MQPPKEKEALASPSPFSYHDSGEDDDMCSPRASGSSFSYHDSGEDVDDDVGSHRDTLLFDPSHSDSSLTGTPVSLSSREDDDDRPAAWFVPLRATTPEPGGEAATEADPDVHVYTPLYPPNNETGEVRPNEIYNVVGHATHIVLFVRQPPCLYVLRLCDDDAAFSDAPRFEYVLSTLRQRLVGSLLRRIVVHTEREYTSNGDTACVEWVDFVIERAHRIEGVSIPVLGGITRPSVQVVCETRPQQCASELSLSAPTGMGQLCIIISPSETRAVAYARQQAQNERGMFVDCDAPGVVPWIRWLLLTEHAKVFVAGRIFCEVAKYNQFVQHDLALDQEGNYITTYVACDAPHHGCGQYVNEKRVAF